MEAIEVEGETVRLEISYTGGCETHLFELVARDWRVRCGSLEVELWLAHDAYGDACKAIMYEQLQFSLQPLIAACRQELAQARGAMTLHIDGRVVACRLGS